MEQIIINGGHPLYGSVSINGAKNAALPVICACILNEEPCIIDNIPPVSDIEILLEILASMGATVKRLSKTSVEINCKHIVPCSSSNEMAVKLRGSSYLLGAEFGRFGKASVFSPGGCSIGARPLDLHMKGFEALGARCGFKAGRIEVESENGPVGSSIYFDKVSVGATANMILASVLADGITVIENAAREPHIVDLAVFLNACGAKISGAGTSMIRIKGVEKLHGCTYELAPDMIEAGTYMVAAAATGGRICVKNVVPKHMESISAKLREIGIPLEITENSITVSGAPSFRGTEIRTNPYPGFPTDMHPQFSALLALSQGMSTVSEGIYSGRFKYVPELNKMGAHIEVVDNAALINGVEELHGAEVKATDLRAGACLVIAALAAHGVTTISGVECIDRGYENLVEKLKFLGANIKRT